MATDSSSGSAASSDNAQDANSSKRLSHRGQTEILEGQLATQNAGDLATAEFGVWMVVSWMAGFEQNGGAKIVLRRIDRFASRKPAQHGFWAVADAAVLHIDRRAVVGA